MEMQSRCAPGSKGVREKMLVRSKLNHEMLGETAGLFVVFIFILEGTLDVEEEGIKLRPVGRSGGKAAMCASHGMLEYMLAPVIKRGIR